MASVAHRIVLCVLLAWSLHASFTVVEAAGWSYRDDESGPSNWTYYASACGGSQQSPIDIVTSSVMADDIGDFSLVGFGEDDIPEGASMSASNNGHGIVVTLSGDYMVSGAGLGSTAYKAVQFHFHWGTVSSRGSEHTIDGKAYPAEMHIVCYNTKYATFLDSLSNADGLTVLGFLLNIQSEDNSAFAPLYDAFADLKFDGDSFALPEPIDFSTLLPEGFESSFYRYSGSLTTPTCNEIVTWNVFKQPIMISESQMGVFRDKFSNELGHGDNLTLTDSFRPPQPLNNRPVTENRERGSNAAQRVAAASTAAIMAAVCLLATGLTE